MVNILSHIINQTVHMVHITCLLKVCNVPLLNVAWWYHLTLYPVCKDSNPDCDWSTQPFMLVVHEMPFKVCEMCECVKVRCDKRNFQMFLFLVNVESFSRSSACLNLNNYLVFLRVMGIQAVALLAHCNYVLASVFLCRAAWKEVQFYTVRKDLP